MNYSSWDLRGTTWVELSFVLFSTTFFGKIFTHVFSLKIFARTWTELNWTAAVTGTGTGEGILDWMEAFVAIWLIISLLSSFFREESNRLACLLAGVEFCSDWGIRLPKLASYLLPAVGKTDSRWQVVEIEESFFWKQSRQLTLESRVESAFLSV